MKKPLDILFLQQEEMIKAGVLEMPRCVEVMEEAFRLHQAGDTLLGPVNKHGTLLFWPETPTGPRMPSAGPDKRVCAMPCYVGGEFHAAGVKWYGSNGANPRLNGWPRSVHLIVLNEPESGRPLVIMDGTLVSAMRTGAMAGVGARLLAEEGADTLGVVGAGVISRAGARAVAASVDTLESLVVYDIDHERASAFAEEIAKELHIQARVADSLQEMAGQCKMICIAVSGTKPVVIEREWLAEGTFLAPLSVLGGAPSLFTDNTIVVDDRVAFREFLDTNIPGFGFYKSMVEEGQLAVNDLMELGHLLSRDEHASPANRSGITTIFSYGMPIQDIAWASAVYARALKKNLGTKLRLWDEPYWL